MQCKTGIFYDFDNLEEKLLFKIMEAVQYVVWFTTVMHADYVIFDLFENY